MGSRERVFKGWTHDSSPLEGIVCGRNIAPTAKKVGLQAGVRRRESMLFQHLRVLG